MPDVSGRLIGVERGFGAFLGTPAEDVIRFTVGQPDAATPLAVVRAAVEALEAGQTAYTDPAGTVAVRQSVATYLSDRHNIPVTGEEVVITPGCKQAVLYGIMASASAGDEILIIAPAWPTYEAQCKMLGIHPVQVPATTDHRPDLDALEAAISDRTKAIMINSPNNPTGAVYSEDEVGAIVDLAERHDLWILDDMIYADLAWTEAGYISPASVGGAHRTITIGGWSKAWSMTGWRMGWIAGPPEIATAATTLQICSATHAATFLMPAGVAAFNCMEEVDRMRATYLERRAAMQAGVEALPGVTAPMPEGAFYILADITGTGMDDLEFAQRALDEAKVQVIPGSLMAHGAGRVRFSYCTDKASILEGCERLRRWLDQNIPA